MRLAIATCVLAGFLVGCSSTATRPDAGTGAATPATTVAGRDGEGGAAADVATGGVPATGATGASTRAPLASGLAAAPRGASAAGGAAATAAPTAAGAAPALGDGVVAPEASGAPLAPAPPPSPLLPLPGGDLPPLPPPPSSPREAVLTACGLAFTPFVVPGLVLGLAGGALPLPVDVGEVVGLVGGPVSGACVALAGQVP